MIPAAQSLKMRIEELRTLRKPLWEQFESNPTEIQLAAKLRIIDDLIADCYEKRIALVTKRTNPATAPSACRPHGLASPDANARQATPPSCESAETARNPGAHGTGECPILNRRLDSQRRIRNRIRRARCFARTAPS
jgi:hypothetical protein